MNRLLSALAHYFTANELTRGRRYSRQGNVLSTNVIVGDEETGVTATTIGSSPAPYLQEIFLHHSEAWDDAELQGFCSCPVGFNCKHVAAVLFTVEKEILEASLGPGNNFYSSAVRDPFSDWLKTASNHTQSNGRNRNADSSFNNQVVAYELHNDMGQLRVKVVKTRRLKSGELSQSNPSMVPINTVRGSEGYLSNLDAEIVIALKFSGNLGWQNNSYQGIRLSGKSGAIALDLIAQTDRFYWGDCRRGLLISSADESDAELDWRVSSDGSQKLILHSEKHEISVFNTDPLIGVNIETLTLLKPILKTPIDNLVELLDAPFLSPEKSKSLSDEEKQALNRMGIPTPLSIEVQDVVSSEITPIIKLGIARDYEDNPCPGAYSIELLVSYNDLDQVELATGDTVLTSFENGQLQRISRDMAEEDRILKQLITDQHLVDLSLFFLGHIPRPGFFGFRDTLDWYNFVEVSLPELKNQGWEVIVDPEFDLTFEEADEWYTEIDDSVGSTWFDLELGIDVSGEQVNLLPVLLELFRGRGFSEVLSKLLEDSEGKFPIEISKGKFVLLENSRLIPILETFVELFDRDTALENSKLKIARSQQLRLVSVSDGDWQWRGGQAAEALQHKLKQFSGIPEVPSAEGFKGDLRQYQQLGLNWLQFLRDFELGGILSDDMGLGKTIQTLAHLCVEKQSGRLNSPCLIVAPTSVVGNWSREVEKFAPPLSVLELQGNQRHHFFDQIAEYDIVLTSYALIVRDVEILKQHRYHYIILDESQKIKNPKAKSSQLLNTFTSSHRLCLTGTPMENHLGELWAQFQFLMPGFLGDEKRFKQLYRNPIERNGDVLRQAALHKRISPVLLRRTKDLVAKELPAKSEIVNYVGFSKEQRDLYESIRLMMNKKLRREIANKGIARSQILILDALLKLRQVCCHPALLKMTKVKPDTPSAKFTLLIEMLLELAAEGRKILLFSQFTSMLALIEEKLKELSINYVKLTGRTRDRQTPIDRFQNGEVDLFLISLKAGGTGLNLTRADTVIHYDPWWNPAVEDQATDRAHRIGQKNPVFVYRLVVEGSVESKILEMQQRKRSLAEKTLSKQDAGKLAITEQDIGYLFEPMPE